MLKLILASRLFAALSDGKRQALAKKYNLEEVQVEELSTNISPLLHIG